MRTRSVNFVYEIFNTGDAVLTELTSNDGVVSDGDALLVHLGKTTLVDQVANTLQVGLTIGEVGLDFANHVDGGLVELEENSIMNLTETQ